MNAVLSNNKNPINFVQESASVIYRDDHRNKKIINRIIKDSKSATESTIEFLEALNRNDCKLPEPIVEDYISRYTFYNNVTKEVRNALKRLMRLEQDDSLKRTYRQLYRNIEEILSIVNKTRKKLFEIQDSQLTSSIQKMSNKSLEDVWKEEDDVWNDFYKESMG